MITATSDVKPSTMPQMMTWLGVAAAVVGGIIMGVANNQKQKAQEVDELTSAMTGLDYSSAAAETAITFGYIGLGVLIFGALLALAGLAVTAARR